MHIEKAKQLLKFSEDLLSHAQSGDWEWISEREPARQQLAHELFQTPVPDEAAATVRLIVEQVAHINNQMLELAQQSRAKVRDALRSSKQAKKDVKTYIDTGG